MLISFFFFFFLFAVCLLAEINHPPPPPLYCARRWSEAYSAGLALPGCPLELAEPSAPMQAAVLVDYFDLVLREPLE